ncbi:MAG: DUF2232 domain-containing protein [Candidatus Hydrogenedentota bacterium]
MSAPAQEELPIIFGLKLIGYFSTLVLLQQLAFILAPVPVVTYALRDQRFQAKVFILVAVLAGISGMIFGLPNLVIPNILMSTMGWLIAWAIQQQVPYTKLVTRLLGFVLIVQIATTAIRWEDGALERQELRARVQQQLDGPEAKSFTDQKVTNLNMQIWLLEHWQDVFVGFTFGGVLAGLCISISWIYRILRKTTGWVPIGTFTDLRPHDAVVWPAIVVALLWFWNSQDPQPWLQVIGYNGAIGLIALYGLNGLGILMYGLDVLKPNPILSLAFLLLLFILGGYMMLGVLGLFDTWGEFRKRIDARAQALRDPPDYDE